MTPTEFEIKVSLFVDDIADGGFGWINDDRVEIEQQFLNYSCKSLSDSQFEILYTALKERDLLYNIDANVRRYKELFNEGQHDNDCDEMFMIRNKLCGLFSSRDFDYGFTWFQ